LYGKIQKAKGFEIYGISLDTEKKQLAKKQLQQMIQKWIHVIDTEGNTAGEWNVNFIPNLYLLDKNRKDYFHRCFPRRAGRLAAKAFALKLLYYFVAFYYKPQASNNENYYACLLYIIPPLIHFI